jgi:hypothetical protein
MSLRVLAFIGAVALAGPREASAQPQRFPLESIDGLRLHNVVAEPAVLDGKKAVRIQISEEARKTLTATPAPGTQPALPRAPLEELAVLDSTTFTDGTIEVEVAGTARTDLFKDARGFVGIAFRVQKDLRTYDAFYLRPTNGRADDQVRRNHATQYISHPDWTWNRLREQTPSKYESYVDLVPGAWTRIRIEVRGQQARLFVHNAEQPTLVVNDLKTGPNLSGAVALWIDIGTVAHFRNLTITPLR